LPLELLAGIGFVLKGAEESTTNTPSLVSKEIAQMFSRDWESPYAKRLEL